jgi:hypothetical protein
MQNWLRRAFPRVLRAAAFAPGSTPCQFLLGQHFVILQRPANLRRRCPARPNPVFKRVVFGPPVDGLAKAIPARVVAVNTKKTPNTPLNADEWPESASNDISAG